MEPDSYDDMNRYLEIKDVTVTIETTLTIPNLKIITIRGTVNRDTILKVDAQVLPVIDKEETDIILNLSTVDYLSTVGMMSIVKYLMRCTDNNRSFKLIKPPKSIYETMIVFGIANRFDIYNNIEEAIGTMQ